MNKAEPTLALKPRGDVIRNPKQGTSGPKIEHTNVSDKNTFKIINIYILKKIAMLLKIPGNMLNIFFVSDRIDVFTIFLPNV